MNISDLALLPRFWKRAIFLTVDTLLVPICLYAAFVFRYGTATPFNQLQESWTLFPAQLAFGFSIIWALGLHRIKLVTFDTHSLANIGAAALGMALSAMALSYIFGFAAPRSVPVLFGLFFFILAVTARLSGLALLRRSAKSGENRQPVAIYGAGVAGVQLAAALRSSPDVEPAFFVDDNPTLEGMSVAGLKVYSPRRLSTLATKHGVQQLLLALPPTARATHKDLARRLEKYGVEVRLAPDLAEFMAAPKRPTEFVGVDQDDVLASNPVSLDVPEVAKSYAGRTIMVTGAGGAIGSELCKQVLECRPANLVLFDQNEQSLFSAAQDVRGLADALGIPVIARLGSVTNKARVSGVIAEEGVEIILHAAAYKHVPLVEENELEGARNNVLGTQVVAEAAAAGGIERFILVSTDKAVRPTNIMGATKRMAELVVQDMQTRNTTTRFAMVRFGNVLGSSGSVLPLFQKQIAAGGPVTVTHAEVTRFFMTIPEASRLVLLAGAYAKGGDVFVLDMGEPQKIIDIAHRMVKLSGRTVKDPETGEGDIEIKVTGLRPGEKLYEELLIDDDSLIPTPHEKILRAQEAMLSQIEVISMLKELQASIDAADKIRLRRLVAARVDGYHVQVVEQGAG